LLSSGVSGLTAIISKNFFKRERPLFEDPIFYTGSFSFPSGYAMAAIAFYGLLAYFIFISSKNLTKKILATIVGILLIVLISFSRIYLGVHCPSDVFLVLF